MRLMRQGVGLLLAGSMVIACQTPQPVYQLERSRTYGQSKEQIWNDVLSFLKKNDITATRVDFAGGSIDAERSALSRCRLGRLPDPHGWSIITATRTAGGKRDRSIATLALAIQVREAVGATDVTLDARFQEQQINPWRNLPFDQRCRSKGVLERTLLDALGQAKSASSIGSE